MGSKEEIFQNITHYTIIVSLISNGLVVFMAATFTLYLLYGVVRNRRKINIINNLGFYSHSQNDHIIHLRTSLYRNWILISVVTAQGLQSILIIASASFEHFLSEYFNSSLHLELQCTSPTDLFPFIASNNPITSSIDGLSYSANCLFILFLSILMSYFVKIYKTRMNPLLLSYRREYIFAVLAISQFLIVWVLFSVPIVGRAGGLIAAIFIVIDFFTLVFFVNKLRVAINDVRQESLGEVGAKYNIVYREYLCISFIFMTSIMIYTLGLLLSIAGQWYFVVLDLVTTEHNGCSWLVGIFYQVQLTPNLGTNQYFKIAFHCLSLIVLITIIQFNCAVIFLTLMHVISNWVRKCRRVISEERPIMLDAETSLASSEYTLSDNYTSGTTSNNESRNSLL